MKEYKDAFGNPIVLGQTYGYTQNSNGVTHTFYGEALRFTAKGYLSIKVEKRFSALYTANVKETEIGRSVSSIKPNLAIRVAISL
jgi:hypothetical protein